MSVDFEEKTRIVPHRFLEYGYYLSMFYAILGPALGLSIGALGVGSLSLLALLCLFTFGSRIRTILSNIAFPLACAVSFILVQVIGHDESIMGPYVRPFFTWIFSLIILQSLSLREGFLHRFIGVMFLIGLMLLPFLRVFGAGEAEVQRFGLSGGVGLSNPNIFAAWFGFCIVYFFIRGLIIGPNVYRLLLWLAALGCFFLVTLTVSRGALLAVALAIIAGGREFLKKGFVPILLMGMLGLGLIGLGVFDDAIRYYTARGAEETGRLTVWPWVIHRFSSSPFIGVGVSDVGTYLSAAKATTPHNGFLFIALSSGILPFIFFVAYWIRAFRLGFSQKVASRTDSLFLLPLLMYSFIETNLSNTLFMSPWAVMSIAIVMEAGGRKQTNVSKSE